MNDHDRDELESILAGALGSTGGAVCLPGCASARFEGDHIGHYCRVVTGAVKNATATAMVQVHASRYASPNGVERPAVTIEDYVYVRPGRGKRKRDERITPAEGYERQFHRSIIHFRPAEARMMAEAILAAVEEAEQAQRAV